jgi:hypothetical protein
MFSNIHFNIILLPSVPRFPHIFFSLQVSQLKFCKHYFCACFVPSLYLIVVDRPNDISLWEQIIHVKLLIMHFSPSWDLLSLSFSTLASDILNNVSSSRWEENFEFQIPVLNYSSVRASKCMVMSQSVRKTQIDIITYNISNGNSKTVLCKLQEQTNLESNPTCLFTDRTSSQFRECI